MHVAPAREVRVGGLHCRHVGNAIGAWVVGIHSQPTVTAPSKAAVSQAPLVAASRRINYTVDLLLPPVPQAAPGLSRLCCRLLSAPDPPTGAPCCRYDFGACLSIIRVQLSMVPKCDLAAAACRAAATAAAADPALAAAAAARSSWVRARPWFWLWPFGLPPGRWLRSWLRGRECALLFTDGYRMAMWLAVVQLAVLCAAPTTYSRYRTALLVWLRAWKALFVLGLGAAAARDEPGWEVLINSALNTAAETHSPLRGAVSLLFAWSGPSVVGLWGWGQPAGCEGGSQEGGWDLVRVVGTGCSATRGGRGRWRSWAPR